jgi:hypothetical protein
MNYAIGAKLKTTHYKTKRKLTRTDGVFPTETMRLHHRIIDWHRKRHIKVRDADSDTPNNLNAYLIDPQYLAKEKNSPAKDVPVTYIPSNIRVYQYSKITRDRDYGTYATAGPLSIASGRMLNTVTLGVEAFITELLARYRTLKTHVSKSHYDIGSGVLPWWRQRMRFFATALVTGGLLVAAVAFTPDKPTSPIPVSAHSNAVKVDKTTASGSSTKSSMVSSPVNGQPANSTNSANGQANRMPQTTLSTSNQQQIPAQQLVTSPVITSPTTTTPSTGVTPTPITTTPVPTPTTTPTVDSIVDPVIGPVTDTVNDVLSTQVQVNTPSLTGDADQPLVEISQ